MTITIKAIFENGVFKPMEKIDLTEHEKVEIRVLSNNEWQTRFNNIIKKIHNKSSKFTDNEIEDDITHAVNECRKQKYGNEDCY